MLVEAPLEQETRPRSLRVGDSLLVVLRGVNLNPGADPEDMVSVRLWLDAYRVITIRDEKLMAIQFLTGLLGINVAGIPGSNNQLAFIIVCVLLGLVAVIELIVFRRKRWL